MAVLEEHDLSHVCLHDAVRDPERQTTAEILRDRWRRVRAFEFIHDRATDAPRSVRFNSCSWRGVHMGLADAQAEANEQKGSRIS
jgi:hypothetical protein